MEIRKHSEKIRQTFERGWSDALKSETSIVFGTLAIAALASVFALGSTLGNQQTLAKVYGHGHVVVVVLHAGHVVVRRY